MKEGRGAQKRDCKFLFSFYTYISLMVYDAGIKKTLEEDGKN